MMRLVANGGGDEALARAIQDLVRSRLSHHEYPRQIEFVAELPKTPAGKVNRKILRMKEKAHVHQHVDQDSRTQLSQDHAGGPG